MLYTVFDIEADGLLDTVTKIHCLSYSIVTDSGEKLAQGSLTKYEEMKAFIARQDCLVGHNIIRYDIPLMKKILGIEVKCEIVDTLGLSWYLYPQTRNSKGQLVKRRQHGLEAWGEELGIHKVKIEDWKEDSVESYIHRCEEDVKINVTLWNKEKDFLEEIYEGKIWRIINYLNFKLDCAREQEENPCYIDRKACEKYLLQIQGLIQEKIDILTEVMPEIIKYRTVKKPKNMYKADGSLSKIGEKWLSLLSDSSSSESSEEIKVIAGTEQGNPNSSSQLKDWLFSLGWEPTIYKDSTSKATGETKQVPQISDDGELCPNIKRLFDEHPYLEHLEGLTILNHRKGVFESFLEAMGDNNYVKSTIDGFTNSLRMQHRKPIANLAKVSKPWGKEIRSLLISPDDEHILCGSDMTALEDTTKQHYMYFFDPEYVKLMRVPGFDPHLDIGLLANMITPEDAEFFKAFKKGLLEKTPENEEKFHHIEGERYLAKTTNFACVYGAGPPKISRTTGMSLDRATLLHTIYWKRNKAVKQVSANVITKVVAGTTFLFNPVSKLWYILRVVKDSFSVLNQSTGVYCFDSCIREYRARGIKISLQYHDEVMFLLKKIEQEDVKEKIIVSVAEVNGKVKLNVPLGCSIDFGMNYSLIH